MYIFFKEREKKKERKRPVLVLSHRVVMAIISMVRIHMAIMTSATVATKTVTMTDYVQRCRPKLTMTNYVQRCRPKLTMTNYVQRCRLKL